MEGLRELAVAIFDNVPVRLAKPGEIDGLFDTLRDPSYSTAIGLIKYAAGHYAPYEIDVNKQMRHRNEDRERIKPIDLAGTPDIPLGIPPAEESKDIKSELATLPSKNEKKSDEANVIGKFWNWATQLF